MSNDTIAKISKKFLRDLPNWEMAPVPACLGGDVRSLTFCCKPGHSLTFGYKCLRDTKLKEIGMDPQEFIKIKEDFSQKHQWDYSETCFGSLSYCCMRQGGCTRRDIALARRYPNQSYEEALAEYYRLKRILNNEILSKAKNQDKVLPFLEICE
ncbi:hypothetical protein NEF87_004734 [Candidatus Lokiarchaeum ossiferum]|uniref:Methanogenesis marker 9 domain-containing protein n=1 Tax=Candidatus Lokiarchaeum ossiferum TaxID=2951803 RepID=A0ABY6I173_9ARCH|nr:hypothetical protein NEF87_004734 [Candidatus Lokiarchaeum sp. B-35]